MSDGGRGTGATTSVVGTRQVVSGGAPGSTVTGRLGIHTAPGSAFHGFGHRRIGLYRTAVQPAAGSGSDATSRPFATTETTLNGAFRFRGVPAGLWFVAPVAGGVGGAAGGVGEPAGGPAGSAQGVWVRVTPSSGAAVEMTSCPECAPR